MAIAIKTVNGSIPEKCFDLLVSFKTHENECLYCTMAKMQQLPFESYCKDGQSILRELSEQPEVYAL